MLAHHRVDYLRNHAHEEDSDACPTCAHADVMEDVPHVFFQCAAYAELRTALFESLMQLAGAALFDAFFALMPFGRAASFLRDNFMSEVPDQLPAIHRLVDSFLVDLVSHRTVFLSAR